MLGFRPSPVLSRALAFRPPPPLVLSPVLGFRPHPVLEARRRSVAAPPERPPAGGAAASSSNTRPGEPDPPGDPVPVELPTEHVHRRLKRKSAASGFFANSELLLATAEFKKAKFEAVWEQEVKAELDRTCTESALPKIENGSAVYDCMRKSFQSECFQKWKVGVGDESDLQNQESIRDLRLKSRVLYGKLDNQQKMQLIWIAELVQESGRTLATCFGEFLQR